MTILSATVPESFAGRCDTYQASVVKLNCCWVFKNTTPPEVRTVCFLCVVRIKQFVRRRRETTTHQGPFVV